MSQRVTRSRAAKIQIEDEIQPRIRDVFKVSRPRTKKDVGKKVLEAPTLPESSTHDVHEDQKPTCTMSKRSKQVIPPTETNLHQTKVETSNTVDVAAGDNDCQSPVRRRKTPTPHNSPASKVSTARKCLTFDEEISTNEPSSSEFPFEMTKRKSKAKITSVMQLQAVLAERGSLRQIHKQNITNKSKKVEEHVTLLKSPTKMVPKGLVIQPSSMVSRERTPEPTIVCPDYVLPSHKTPAKEVDLEKEEEEEEKKRVFDYGKASRLIDPVKESANLPLPSHYESLVDSFQSCDRIISIYMSQGRRCQLAEIQKNVRKNTKKDFQLKHVSQILHVYPESYCVRVEEQRQTFGAVISGQYEHVISANLSEDLKMYMLPESPMKQANDELPLVLPGKCLSPMKSPKKKVPALPRAPELDTKPRLEGWRITCRRYVFRYLLSEKVKAVYQKFMEKIGGPVISGPIRRFHPKFLVKIDSECSELEEATLAEAPKRGVDLKIKEMKQFMDAMEPEAVLPKSVDIALQELKSPVKSIVSASRNVPLSPKKFAELQANKPKGTMTLLERIRAKEAAKKMAEATKDPVVERRKAILQRLEKNLLRTVLCLYTRKNCRSMELSVVIEKVVYTLNKTISSADVKSHIQLLCEIAPEYCEIKESVNRHYLMMTETDFKKLGDIVRSELSRLSA